MKLQTFYKKLKIEKLKKVLKKIVSIIQGIILLPMYPVYYVYYFYTIFKTLRKSDMIDYHGLSQKDIENKITDETSSEISGFDKFLIDNSIGIHIVCIFFWLILIFHITR